MTTHLMAVKTRGNHTSENYRPTEDEPFMSNRQRAYFRSKLLGWRNEILRSTKETPRSGCCADSSCKSWASTLKVATGRASRQADRLAGLFTIAAGVPRKPRVPAR